MRLFKTRAQSTAEYAILFALVIGAAAAMQVYIKRGLQGGVKYATDKLKSSDTGTGQYEPYYSMSESTTKRENVYYTDDTNEDGEVSRTSGNVAGGEKTTRSYRSAVRGVENAEINNSIENPENPE